MNQNDRQETDIEKSCDYCDTTALVYELRSDKGVVNRCLPCLAIEQGQQGFQMPFEAFVDFEYAESSYESTRDWFRILARIRKDDPILKRDPDDYGTVGESTRTFLTNFMGADAHKKPSELTGSES